MYLFVVVLFCFFLATPERLEAGLRGCFRAADINSPCWLQIKSRQYKVLFLAHARACLLFVLNWNILRNPKKYTRNDMKKQGQTVESAVMSCHARSETDLISICSYIFQPGSLEHLPTAW